MNGMYVFSLGILLERGRVPTIDKFPCRCPLKMNKYSVPTFSCFLRLHIDFPNGMQEGTRKESENGCTVVEPVTWSWKEKNTARWWNVRRFIIPNEAPMAERMNPSQTQRKFLTLQTHPSIPKQEI